MARETFSPLTFVALALVAAACCTAYADEIGPWEHDDRDAAQALVDARPMSLGIDRALLARTLGVAVYRPGPAAAERRGRRVADFGGGATDLVWRVGPQVVRPVAREDPLGAGDWQAGVASVAFAVEGVRMYGALASDRCTLAGEVDRGAPSGFLIQPFVNYNLPDGWYLASVPVISADWTAPSGQKWTVPLGASIGRLARLGDVPVTVQAGYYYNVERPDGGADWALNLRVRLSLTR